MASEIRCVDTTGKTLYAILRNQAGNFWNGASFAAYSDGNWSSYAISMAENGTSGLYDGTFPSGQGAAAYSIIVYERAGGTAAIGDRAVAEGTFYWTSAAVGALAKIDTTGNIYLAAANVTGNVPSDTVNWKGSAAPAMTGDAFARLGTPAGASIAADVATRAQPGDAMALTTGERTTLAASIWNALTSGMATAGSIGKRIVDFLTGDIFTRLGAPSGATTAADIAAATAVLNTLNHSGAVQLDFSQALSLTPTSGTVGHALAAALADAVGKITYSPPVSNPGTGTLTLYAKDGTTVLAARTVTTDSNGNVTDRS